MLATGGRLLLCLFGFSFAGASPAVDEERVENSIVVAGALRSATLDTDIAGKLRRLAESIFGLSQE